MKNVLKILALFLQMFLLQQFLPSGDGTVVYAIGPLAIAGIGLGAQFVGKAFGGKPKLTAEQVFAKEQLQSIIQNKGFLPGQRESQTSQLIRNIASQSNLQKSITGERLAAIPGNQNTAFADSQLAGIDRNFANSFIQGLSNLDIDAQNRVLQAIIAIAGIQPQPTENFADLVGNLGAQTTGFVAGTPAFSKAVGLG